MKGILATGCCLKAAMGTPSLKEVNMAML